VIRRPRVAFRTPEPLPGSQSRLLWKAVAGGSYRLPFGSGVLVFAEYHYSQFGASNPAEIIPLLSNSTFAARYARGDTQILGRHAIATTASYEQSPEVTLSSQWVQSPADGSGVVAPAVTLTLGDRVSVLLATYLPYGQPPTQYSLHSEYGSAARSGFLQLRLYM
jgi:hypothetical protein